MRRLIALHLKNLDRTQTPHILLHTTTKRRRAKQHTYAAQALSHSNRGWHLRDGKQFLCASPRVVWKNIHRALPGSTLMFVNVKRVQIVVSHVRSDVLVLLLVCNMGGRAGTREGLVDEPSQTISKIRFCGLQDLAGSEQHASAKRTAAAAAANFLAQVATVR